MTPEIVAPKEVRDDKAAKVPFQPFTPPFQAGPCDILFDATTYMYTGYSVVTPTPPTHCVWWVYPAPPPPVGLWCWVVVLPGSVGLFASVLLVGVLCTPPPPLWPCGGPAVLAYMHACFLPVACGWQVICLECEPKCLAILAQAGASRLACCPEIFEKPWHSQEMT